MIFLLAMYVTIVVNIMKKLQKNKVAYFKTFGG